jgi:hypothetical protein
MALRHLFKMDSFVTRRVGCLTMASFSNALGGGAAQRGTAAPGSFSLFNTWIPWSPASAGVAYNTPGDAGPGEEKVAAEFGAPRFGPNSPYDMDAVVGGVQYKFEVKEPDAADSFPCGRNGRDALRPVKAQIASLLLCFGQIVEHPAISEGLRSTLQDLAKVSPDELCESNIVKLNDSCHALSALRQTLQASLPTVSSFNPFTGETTNIKATQYVATAKVWGMPESAVVERIGADVLATVRLLDSLTTVYIDAPERLLADLTSLRNIFRDYVLVLVHKDKGYYLMEAPETKIVFNRITRGHPRFKVDVMERPAASPRGGRRRRTAPHSPAAGTY